MTILAATKKILRVKMHRNQFSEPKSAKKSLNEMEKEVKIWRVTLLFHLLSEHIRMKVKEFRGNSL